jgi:hypothetical protein
MYRNSDGTPIRTVSELKICNRGKLNSKKQRRPNRPQNFSLFDKKVIFLLSSHEYRGFPRDNTPATPNVPLPSQIEIAGDLRPTCTSGI